MKEKIQNLLIGAGLAAAAVVCFVISGDYTMSLGSFHLDYRIAGAFFGAVGLVFLLLGLLKKPAPAASVRTPEEAPAMPEDPMDRLRVLEEAMEADPENVDLAREFLSCSDLLMQAKGDKSFPYYQQRFCIARRAVYMEEKYGLSPAFRRYRVIHSAVHGGIAAATARDRDQMEDSLDMLIAAAGLQSEGTRDLDRLYSEVSVPAVTCWVSYWLSRSYLGEQPNYRRSAELLKQAAALCPPEGIRACDLNPRMAENVKIVLTPTNLGQLKHHLLSKVKPKTE